MTTCPACHHELQAEQPECPHCSVIIAKWKPHPQATHSESVPSQHTPVTASTLSKSCSQCKGTISPEKVWCPHCGHPIGVQWARPETDREMKLTDTEMELAEVVVRRWRKVIFSVALIPPLIAMLLAAVSMILGFVPTNTNDLVGVFLFISILAVAELMVLEFVPIRMPIRIYGVRVPLVVLLGAVAVLYFRRGHASDDNLVFLSYIVLTIAFCAWPFFVYAGIVARHVRASWPDVDELHWPIIGGLIGLSGLYVLEWFSFGIFLATPHAPGSGGGQGAGLLLTIAPFVGAVLAPIGWFIGLGVARLR